MEKITLSTGSKNSFHLDLLVVRDAINMGIDRARITALY